MTFLMIRYDRNLKIASGIAVRVIYILHLTSSSRIGSGSPTSDLHLPMNENDCNTHLGPFIKKIFEFILFT